VKSFPRILPLAGVAIGGVLAINALSGADDVSGLLTGARAFAEEAAKPSVKSAKPVKETAATGEAKDAVGPAPTLAPKPVCAPTAAELAKQAGLSPAELQVLQSLGQRRGQLDKRENDFSTQLALMAAAEAKLDAKIRTLNGLKAEVQGLVTQNNSKQAAEIDRLVKVFEGMKAKDAAPRMVGLDDSVRLPIAAKMKERSLSAILAQMPPAEARKLTESLARRFSSNTVVGTNASATAPATAPAATPVAAPPATQAAAKPASAAKPAPRKRAPAAKQAAAKPAPAKLPAAKPAPPAAAAAPAAAPPSAPVTPAPAAPAPAEAAKPG
jgi:flagellar motility protein MotE (MotC chaperone)